MKLKGVYTALITPFLENEKVDEPSLKALVEAQIQAGVSGLVPMGTTGESPTMAPDEHIKVIEKVVEWSKGRVPVIAGTGSNSTQEAIELTKRAKAAGAQYTLQVVPYYNKPNQEGMYRHFSTIAEATALPMIIYNIAGRTGKNMETETLMRLTKNSLVVGVKEASGDMAQIMDVLSKRPEGFTVLSGDDNLTLPMMCLGADGVISVACHLIPQEMVQLCKSVWEGKIEEARKIHFKYLPLFKSMFIDTNPIPVKTALALQGRINEVFRLPMTETDPAKKQAIKAVLTDLGLLA